MRLSLSAISTVNASFEEDVRAYAAAGFDAIGLWELKLPPDDDANVALLRSHGLEASNCVPTVPSFLQLAIPRMEGPEEPEARIEALCTSIRRLAAYEPDCVLCLSGPAGRYSETEARAIVREGLQRCSAVAREAGVRLGLEPIHPGQREVSGLVCSLGDALAVLDEAGLDEVGIMADTYNLAGEDPRDLARIVDRVTGLHVADVPHDEAPGVRVLPGEGRGRSAEFVAALRDAGWDGTLDVEIFSTPEGFWSLPNAEAARRAFAAVARLAG